MRHVAPTGLISVKGAVRLLQSGHRAILEAARVLGIPLHRSGTRRYMSLTEMDRVGEWLDDRPRRTAGLRHYAAERDPPAAIRDLAQRIEAARWIKRSSFGLCEVTDERLDAAMSHWREQEVAS